MSIFTKNEWKDRISDNPSRRRLTPVVGMQNVFDVTREEGDIAQQGTAFSSYNMNNLEERIFDSFNNTENRINNARNGTVLIQNGGVNGTIELTNGDRFTNYDYLDIFYKENQGRCLRHIRAIPRKEIEYDEHLNQSKWKLSDIRHYDGGTSETSYIVINCKSIIINDTSITTSHWCRFDVKDGQFPVRHNNAGDDDLFILKIVGYNKNI